MKVTTTFWSAEIHEFDNLLYINGNTKEIMYHADLNNTFQTFVFFKEIAKFVKSKIMRKTLSTDRWNNKEDYYQFAVIVDNEITPIKWFNLHIGETVVISHDIAFETTLIKKNEVEIPFGRFPMFYYRNTKNPKLPKYREFNIKAKAYKYISNQVKSSF